MSVEDSYVRSSVILQREFGEIDVEVMDRMYVGTFIVLNEELSKMKKEEKEYAENKGGQKKRPSTLRM